MLPGKVKKSETEFSAYNNRQKAKASLHFYQTVKLLLSVHTKKIGKQ